MPNIWSRTSETVLSAEETRDRVQLHLLRHLGEAHVAFADTDGWAGKGKEPGPPVDVLVIPPEGERRFAYVCSFGSCLTAPDPAAGVSRPRMEFSLAVTQTGEAKRDLAALNLAANVVRQFAKLVHMQSVRIQAGETVRFAPTPTPMFEGSRQMAFAFMRPRLPADGFVAMRTPSGHAIEFWSPVPIYRPEWRVAQRKGPQALDRALRAAGVTEMLHLDRPSSVRRSLGDLLRSLLPGAARD